MLDIPPDTFDAAYNRVSNSVLWFVNHLLFDTPSQPRFDAAFRRDWASYVAYNEAFAEALAGESGKGTRVLVQDYLLALVPRLLRDRRYRSGSVASPTLRDRRRLRVALTAHLGLDVRLRGLWALPPATVGWRVTPFVPTRARP